MDQVLYGAAYYDEYMPYDRLEQDIRMMQEAGINVVRIAESTWSTLEPQDGVFDFTHIDRVLNAMEQANISVIVGTPTYAVPTWLVREYPDVLAVTKNGRNQYGPRQNMDITNAHYLFYAERIIRVLLEHVKDHPAVIGYQVDNETKHYGTSGPNVQAMFVTYMQEKFPELEQLNHAFGLDYWSNRINAWEDFPNVNGTINGSLAAEFSKFQRKLVTDFLNWQVGIVREYKRADQFITHNFDFAWKGHSYGVQPDVNHFEAAKELDLAGVDIYHPSQDELTGREIAFCGDLARGMKQDNYLVLETEAQGFTDWVPYPGQLRLQAFSHLASGADMVEYWHWHSLHNAIETYWKGLLSHDLMPNPVYWEAKTVGMDLKRIGSHLLHLRKSNKVAVLVSNEALTALNLFSGFQNGLEYNDVVRRMYDALYHMNVECDIIHPDSKDLERYRMILVPSLYAAPDELLYRLNQFAKTGGCVVYGVRSGFCDEQVKVRSSAQPGIICAACGATYSEFTAAKQVCLKDIAFPIQGSADSHKLEAVIELLEPQTGEELARYDHPYWQKYAAITKARCGKGMVVYMGCLPDIEVMEGLLRFLLQENELWGRDQQLHFPLITRSGVNAMGRTLHYYFNYSGEAVQFVYPHKAGTELLEDKPVSRKEELTLKPWGVFIIEESAGKY